MWTWLACNYTVMGTSGSYVPSTTSSGTNWWIRSLKWCKCSYDIYNNSIAIKFATRPFLMMYVQCSAVQCSAVQCSAVQCSAVHRFIKTWKFCNSTLLNLIYYSIFIVLTGNHCRWQSETNIGITFIMALLICWRPLVLYLKLWYVICHNKMRLTGFPHESKYYWPSFVENEFPSGSSLE